MTCDGAANGLDTLIDRRKAEALEEACNCALGCGDYLVASCFQWDANGINKTVAGRWLPQHTNRRGMLILFWAALLGAIAASAEAIYRAFIDRFKWP